MTYNRWNAQVNLSNDTVVLGGFPAGTTLIKARMRSQLHYLLAGSGSVFPQTAPPNLYTAVWWAATGTSIPTIDASNANSTVWFGNELGIAVNWSAEWMLDVSGSWYTQRNEYYDWEVCKPNFQALAFNVGLSFNWLGAGFFGVTPWVSYTVEAWTY